VKVVRSSVVRIFGRHWHHPKTRAGKNWGAGTSIDSNHHPLVRKGDAPRFLSRPFGLFLSPLSNDTAADEQMIVNDGLQTSPQWRQDKERGNELLFLPLGTQRNESRKKTPTARWARTPPKNHRDRDARPRSFSFFLLTARSLPSLLKSSYISAAMVDLFFFVFVLSPVDRWICFR